MTRAQEEELDELRNGSHEIQVSFGHQLLVSEGPGDHLGVRLCWAQVELLSVLCSVVLCLLHCQCISAEHDRIWFG